MKNAMIDIGDKEGILHMTINETSIDVRYAEQIKWELFIMRIISFGLK